MRKKKKYDLDKRFVAWLRREWWFRCETRKEALKKAQKDAQFGSAMWECSKCVQKFVKVCVDHIKPVGRPKDKKGKLDWNELRDRMWFGKMQVLCSKHHNEKTQKERASG